MPADKREEQQDLAVSQSDFNNPRLPSKYAAKFKAAVPKGEAAVWAVVYESESDRALTDAGAKTAIVDTAKTLAGKLQGYDTWPGWGGKPVEGKDKYGGLAPAMAANSAPKRRSSGGGKRNDAGMRSRGNATPSVTIRRR